MNDNLYMLEKLAQAYRQRRLQDAERSRQVHELLARGGGRPAWCALALAVSRGLIALAQRLQALAGSEPEPSCETC